MKILRKSLILLLIVALLLGTALPAFAVDSYAATDELVQAQADGEEKGFRSEAFRKLNTHAYAEDDEVRAIVLMSGKGTAFYDANAVSRALHPESKIVRQHQTLMTRMQKMDIAYTLNYEYTTLLNGIAVSVPYSDLERIADMPGVDAVYIANHYAPPDDCISSNSADEMIQASWLHTNCGGDGSGTVIAVLDTGITPGHEAFQQYPGMLQQPAISEIKAKSLLSELGRGIYLSSKIPFAYDYSDRDNDATDDSSATGGHGTHVAAITAGYVASDDGAIKFSGSAPDAQILAMKIFSSGMTSGTSSDVYFAALEDAYRLGADVINMSLGSPNGFTYDSELENEVYGNIYKKLQDAGIICCIAAGNEGTMATYANTAAGDGYLTADYTDFGTVSSPATYGENLAIASAENAQYPAYALQAGGRNIIYKESSASNFRQKLSGKTLEYVVVPGYGEKADYADLDVSGKTALVSRGKTTFSEKVSCAYNAGASAVLIYNQDDSGLFEMSVNVYGIPAAFIAKADGEYLASLDDKTFTVTEDKITADSPTGWRISTFSSWGCTNDLKLKPQITGIGGNVYSAQYRTENGYVTKSGTSMATPNASGAYASLLEILRERYPKLRQPELAELTQTLTESTAKILTDPSGIPYSPRAQGAGLLDLKAAAEASAYIKQPLLSLGDDPGKSGVFTCRFAVQNLTDHKVTYNIVPTILCIQTKKMLVGEGAQSRSSYYNTTSEEDVTQLCSWFTDQAENQVCIPANGCAEVTVTLSLSDSLKARFDRLGGNGTFVEGYISLESDETEALHATYLGYYGNWATAPLTEEHDYRDMVDAFRKVSQECMGGTYRDIVNWDVNTDVSAAYMAVKGTGDALNYAGDNPLGYDSRKQFSDRHISVSTNTAAAADIIYITPINIRNARHIIMVVQDTKTGEIYKAEDVEYVPKTSFDASSGYWTYGSLFSFNGTQTYDVDETEILPNGTEVTIDFYGNIAYGEDALSGISYEDLSSTCSEYRFWSLPCTVDSLPPEIKDWSYDYNTGILTVTASDEQYLAGISVLNAKKTVIAQELYSDDTPGQEHTASLYIGQQRNITILCSDYATNETKCKAVLQINPSKVGFSVPDNMRVNGDVQYTVSSGDQIVLPSVTGDVEGHTFIGWSTAQVESPVNEKPDAVYAPGETCVVYADTNFYAVFRSQVGVRAPDKELARCQTELDDWSGSYAIGGVDWSNYNVCFLAHDASTVNAQDAGVQVQGRDTLYKTPDTLLYRVEKAGDEYTLRSVKTGMYLQADTSAANGLTMTYDNSLPQARWNISYCAGDPVIGNVSCMRVTSIASPEKRLVFVSEDQTMKCVKADDEQFDDEMNLYLYGCVPEYAYTTAPSPIHTWDTGTVKVLPTDTQPGKLVQTCIVCGTTRETIIPATGKCNGGTECPSHRFYDIDGPESWSHAGIDFCVQNGLFSGTAEHTFEPNASMTRAMLVMVLWNIEGKPAPSGVCPFADVPTGCWYTDAVTWAAENGIVSGIGNGRFAPTANITREQIAVMIQCYAKSKGEATGARADLTSYPDYSQVSGFAKDAMSWATAEGMISGSLSGGKVYLLPQSNATRAQAAAILMRFMTRVSD